MPVVRGRRVGILVGLVVAVLLACCAGAVLVVRHEIAEAKDSRDLADLTLSSPWPRDQLLLPDELPTTGVSGSVGHDGLTLSYPVDDTVPPRLIEYDVQVLDEHDEPVSAVSCDAIAVVVCTDLGGGYTLVRVLDTDNSDPATGVRRRVGDRVLIAAVLGDHPEDVDRLRRIVTETHQPTDAELLRVLRPDGYRTDWS